MLTQVNFKQAFIRAMFIGGFLFTSIYHMIGMFRPEFVEPSSFVRHLVFIVINVVSAFLLYWNRPRPLLLLIPLILQQIVSHGVYFWEVYHLQNRIDWASVIVCLTMPVLGWFVYKRNA